MEIKHLNKKDNFILSEDMIKRLDKCIYSNVYSSNKIEKKTIKTWYISEDICLVHIFGCASFKKYNIDNTSKTYVYEIYEWVYNNNTINSQECLIKILNENLIEIENTCLLYLKSKKLSKQINSSIISNNGQFQNFYEIGWNFKNVFKITINKMNYRIFLNNIQKKEINEITEEQLFKFINQNQSQIEELLKIYKLEQQDNKVVEHLKQINLNVSEPVVIEKKNVRRCESIFIKKSLKDRYRYQACKELIDESIFDDE